MSFPPPPQDPQGHGSSGSSGFGPPHGFGPAPGGPPAGPPPAGGGFGPPGSGSGSAGPGGHVPPPGYGAPYGQPGFPGQPYGTPPQPPGGGNRGAKVAAIVVGSVLAAAVAVGGVVLWAGDDGGSGRAEATQDRSPGTEEPGSGADDPSSEAEEAAPGASARPDPALPSPPADGLVPFVVLEPGQCFDHPALSSDVSEVETRSCDEPHNGEVISNDKLTGTFADEQALQAKVKEVCHADVQDRLATMPADGKMYYYYAIYPSLGTYLLGEDDTISCAITLSDALDGPKLTAPLPD